MPFHLLPEDLKLDRRGFLASLAAIGAGATLARAADEPGYLALLSDTHVDADPAKVARDQTMAKNLKVVVDAILKQPNAPAGVFVDGDLALKDGQEGDYKTFLNLLEPIRAAKLPIHLGLGNHDDRVKFRATLKGSLPVETKLEEKQVGVVSALGLRVVVLDSLDQVNVTPGVLGETQTKWLAKELDSAKDVPTLIFVHHNLKAAGEAGLVDDEELLKVIEARKQVKAVIFGHTHVWDVRKDEAGIYRINLPAVGYPFSAAQPIGWTKLTPTAAGAKLQLHAIGGNKAKDGEIVELSWR